MNKNIIIGLVALVVIGGGTTFALSRSSEDSGRVISNQGAMSQDEAMRMENDESEAMAMAKESDGEAMSKESDAMAMSTKGSYGEYDQAKLANAEKGDVVLFFHANWCPKCQEADKNFKASSAPDGLTLLKLDYDKETELKQKYGVTYQHTYVAVDKDGKLIKKWNGSYNYDDVVGQVN